MRGSGSQFRRIGNLKSKQGRFTYGHAAILIRLQEAVAAAVEVVRVAVAIAVK